MSLEKAKEALKKITEDPEFSRKMINVKSDQEAMDLLASQGYNFTREEFDKAKHEMRVIALSDKELEGVAGGDNHTSAAVPVAESITVGAAASAF